MVSPELDARLQSLAISMGKSLDEVLLQALTEFADTWESLAELGWVRITPSQVQLVGDGVFYTPLIQSLLARDRVLELGRTGFARSAELT